MAIKDQFYYELQGVVIDASREGFIDSISEATISRLDAQYKALEAENKRLRALLGAAVCPNCDKSGAYYDGQGEVCQCQWCYEVNLNPYSEE